MLIKKQKLAKIKTLHSSGVIETMDTLQESPQARAIKVEIHKAKQEASEIKSKAQKVLKDAEEKLEVASLEAREIVNNANKQAVEIKKKAYTEARQKAYAEANAVKEQAKELMKELYEVKREALYQAHSQIINVALDLAEKILRHQANIDTNTLKTQVTEAIKKATTETDHVKVYVCPEDLPPLKNLIPEIKLLFPSGIEIIPFAGENIDKGSCIVETKSGQLDATFATQLETLANIVSYLEVGEPDVNKSIEDSTSIGEQKVQETLEEFPDNTVDFSEELEIQGGPLTQEEPEQPIVEIKEEKEQAFDLEARLEEEFLPPSTSKPPQEKVFDLASRLEEEALPPSPIEQVTKPPVTNEISTQIEYIEEPIIESPKEEDTKPSETKTKYLPDSSGKKKLQISTKEDLEEEGDFEELEEDKEDQIKTSGILKPKKGNDKSSEVASIAEEVEKNPEWKGLLQDDDE
ncbi:MAG: hypothetical protein HYR97_07910 [Candidatus Melainabacteria bacterium]|nr:hypothetical protein [Candidatus Melainabacteria bacterium]MBI3308409.1 hypothetical protein [Candidatus Melainabacteria bacterium]